jgi:outer membrane lipoprotein carrier protein
MFDRMISYFQGRWFGIVAAWLISLSVFSIGANTLMATPSQPALNELLARMQGAYEQTRDFQAYFVQEVSIKSVKRTDREEGTVYFKNPHQTRWDYEKPRGKKLVVSAKKAWLYVPEDKIVYVQNAEGFLRSKLAVRFLSGIGKLREDFNIEYALSPISDQGSSYLLILTPKDTRELTKKLYLSVDAGTLQIVACRFTDSYGNETKIRFTQARINQGLPDSLFTFKPPLRVDIVDIPQ